MLLFLTQTEINLGLTTQFPSQGMGWPIGWLVHSLEKSFAVSGDQTVITCVAIEFHDHYTTAAFLIRTFGMSFLTIDVFTLKRISHLGKFFQFSFFICWRRQIGKKISHLGKIYLLQIENIVVSDKCS